MNLLEYISVNKEHSLRVIREFASFHKSLAETFGDKKAMETVYINIDNLLLEVTSKAIEKKTPIICKKGCNYCCHSDIYLSDREFLHIVDYMEKWAILPDMIQVDKLDIPLDDFKVLPWQERRCPMLVDGLCITYPVRPIVCRNYNSISTDPKLCIKESLVDASNNNVNQEAISLPASLYGMGLISLDEGKSQLEMTLHHRLKKYLHGKKLR